MVVIVEQVQSRTIIKRSRFPPPRIDELIILAVLVAQVDEGLVMLVFDLFVGAWEARDAKRQGIPHLALVPCLLATLMFGPAGLLAYLALRGVMRRTETLAES